MVAEAMLIKLAWVIAGLVTGGGAWWIKRLVSRVDLLENKVHLDSERLTKIESESLTEAEIIRMMSEMERRVMSNFKEFRLEFKEDLSEFRANLKEDIRDSRHHHRG